MKSSHHHNYPIHSVPTFPLHDILRLFCLNSAARGFSLKTVFHVKVRLEIWSKAACTVHPWHITVMLEHVKQTGILEGKYLDDG